MQILQTWYQRNFSDPQAVLLVVLLLVIFGVFFVFGNMLTPVFAAIVIAYLLEWPIRQCETRRMPRVWAVLLIWLLFVILLLLLVFGLLPLLSVQLAAFIPEISTYWAKSEAFLVQWSQHYRFVSPAFIQQLISNLSEVVGTLGKNLLLGGSLKDITSGVITLIVYLVLLPLLVFFFLKDKGLILAWFGRFLPRQRALMLQVWTELDRQLGNYIRGKVWEIAIVAAATYLVFTVFGLKYAFLLAVVVGMACLIPYIGVIIVSIPVLVVAFFQFGLSGEFIWMMVLYLVIQGLDGAVLVPLMFSGVVNLHPVAIIVSVLVFGGLWGFWGVFFAIPLATLINALLHVWPQHTNLQDAAR
ncbi:MAG: AI-2E family transporter [Gammaproteobacteria bacterium]|nr:AI-2E family transporter [Gammaproteobacteria bacterium]